MGDDPQIKKEESFKTPVYVLSIDVGTRNLALGIYQRSPEKKVIWAEKWDTKKGTINQSCREAVDRLWQFKDKGLYFVEYVLIENQGYATSQCKRMYQALEAHFQTIKLIYNLPYEIITCQPMGKWSFMDNSKVPKDYKERKKLAVDVFQNLIRELNPKMQEALDKVKKKDDIAESALQGWFYPIPKKLVKN